MTQDFALRRFMWFALATIAIIYMLIMVGGIVRATGAGMGCPDWPTCFGQWVPPTHESQLPANYQEIYADRGYAETGFNVIKTWTEYLNRLLGVFTGLAILLTVLFAWPLRRRTAGVFGWSLAAFLLVGFQGWLGSRVVASNLNPGMITAHMLVAQMIVGIIILAVLRAVRPALRAIRLEAAPRWLYAAMIAAVILGLAQMVLGTQVREAVDLIAREHARENRHLWIDALPWLFDWHRYSSVLLAGLNGLIVYKLLEHSRSRILDALAIALGVQILGTVVIGMAMHQLHLPMFAQPLHLWLASLISGTQLALLVLLHRARRESAITPQVEPPSGTAGRQALTR